MADANLSDLETDNGSCFLCGSRNPSVTQEHVFPKWLQQRYDLWDETIELLNGTEMPYRQLKIPCCAACNREDLSRLEGTISAAVAAGYDACSKLDERLLYSWAGKIYFGILRKEVDLSADRSRADSEKILPAATLKSFSDLHLFLQGVRGAHEFPKERPYSVLVCNLHDVGSPRDYCFRDSLFHMTLAIRMGEIGIVVALEDCGLTKGSYGSYLAAVAGRKLHPVQFDELYAKALYQASLVQGGITYITTKAISGVRPAQTRLLDGGYVHQWSQEEYSRVLEPIVSVWLRSEASQRQWFVPPNLVPTWMTDQAGELLLQPLSRWEGAALDA